MKLIGRSSAPDEMRWQIYNRIAVRILPLLLIAYTIACIDRVNVAFAKLQMGADFGLSNAMYGFGAGIFFVGYCLFEIPSNIILHKVGARLWLARIMIVWGVLSALSMFVSTPGQFYAIRFLLGVSEAGFYPGALYFLTLWFPRHSRGQAVAFMLLGASLSSVIGSPLSGAIMRFLDMAGGLRGWQWLFVLEGIPATIMGFVLLARLPNRPAEAPWLSDADKGVVAADLADEHETQAAGRTRHDFGQAFHNINIWCLVLANFCNLCSLYGVQFWQPTIIQRAVQADVFVTGLVAAGLTVIPCVALILNARHSDRTGDRRKHAVFSFSVTCLGMAIAGTFSEDPYLVLVGLVVASSGVAMTSGMIFALPGTFTQGAAAAAGFALITTIGNGAGYFSPFVIGLLRDATGNFSAAFYCMGAAALTGAATILLTPGLRGGRSGDADPAPAPEAAA